MEGTRIDPAALIAGLSTLPAKQGAEHRAYVDCTHQHVVKLTNPGEFGAEEQGLEGYVARLQRSNALFEDATQVLGWVQFPGEAGPRMVTQQPLYVADAQRPEPTQREIDVYMRAKGFLRAYEGAYLHESRDLVASDAVPKNFVRTPAGRIHAVDVIVLVPSANQHERLQAQVYHHEQVPQQG